MTIRRQISIPEDIDKFLSGQPNASGYIVQLIKADIENKKPMSREYIMKLIQEYMTDNHIQTGAKEVDLEVQDSLSQFINLG